MKNSLSAILLELQTCAAAGPGRAPTCRETAGQSAIDIVGAAFKDFDFRPDLRTLRIPALVVEGAETRVPMDATEE